MGRCGAVQSIVGRCGQLRNGGALLGGGGAPVPRAGNAVCAQQNSMSRVGKGRHPHLGQTLNHPQASQILPCVRKKSPHEGSTDPPYPVTHLERLQLLVVQQEALPEPKVLRVQETGRPGGPQGAAARLADGVHHRRDVATLQGDVLQQYKRQLALRRQLLQDGACRGSGQGRRCVYGFQVQLGRWGVGSRDTTTGMLATLPVDVPWR